MKNTEKVELLISEGINYLSSQLDRLELKSNQQNNTFQEFIKQHTPLSVNEKINKILEEDKLESYERIIDVFNGLNNFIYSEKELLRKNNTATNKELQVIFFQYVNMLENNLKEKNLSEMFADWCEDGNVFYQESLKLSERSMKKCVSLMNYFTNKLDDFTDELNEVYQLEESNEYFEPFKDPEEDFMITNNPRAFDYMEYKGFRVCYIEDTNTIVIHQIIPGEEESYSDYDDTIVNWNYTRKDLKEMIDKDYIREDLEEENLP